MQLSLQAVDGHGESVARRLIEGHQKGIRSWLQLSVRMVMHALAQLIRILKLGHTSLHLRLPFTCQSYHTHKNRVN